MLHMHYIIVGAKHVLIMPSDLQMVVHAWNGVALPDWVLTLLLGQQHGQQHDKVSWFSHVKDALSALSF